MDIKDKHMFHNNIHNQLLHNKGKLSHNQLSNINKEKFSNNNHLYNINKEKLFNNNQLLHNNINKQYNNQLLHNNINKEK